MVTKTLSTQYSQVLFLFDEYGVIDSRRRSKEPKEDTVVKISLILIFFRLPPLNFSHFQYQTHLWRNNYSNKTLETLTEK